MKYAKTREEKPKRRLITIEQSCETSPQQTRLVKHRGNCHFLEVYFLHFESNGISITPLSLIHLGHRRFHFEN